MFYTEPRAVQQHCGPRRFLWVGMIMLMGAVLAASVWADGFQVQRVVSRFVEGRGYVLDADLDFRFSNSARDALESGVPLTVEIQIQVLRPRGWVWDEVLVDLQRRYRLEYHALARQYLVTDLNSGELSTFPGYQSAVNALGRLRQLRVLVRDTPLDPSRGVYGRLRARLDIEALPAPLRPVAYLSPDWRLTSEWSQWVF